MKGDIRNLDYGSHKLDLLLGWPMLSAVLVRAIRSYLCVIQALESQRARFKIIALQYPKR